MFMTVVRRSNRQRVIIPRLTTNLSQALVLRYTSSTEAASDLLFDTETKQKIIPILYKFTYGLANNVRIH